MLINGKIPLLGSVGCLYLKCFHIMLKIYVKVYCDIANISISCQIVWMKEGWEEEVCQYKGSQ